MLLLLGAGCEQAKEAGDETARELTGSRMVEQGQKVQQQLQTIDRQQQQRMNDLDAAIKEAQIKKGDPKAAF